MDKDNPMFDGQDDSKQAPAKGTEPGAEPSPQPDKPDDDFDANATIEKLQKRLNSETGKKHDLQDQLDKANAKIEELLKLNKKGVKDLSDEEKAKQAESEKDKQIASLRAELARNKSIAETDAVFKEAGLNVNADLLNVLVVDDSEQTLKNAKLFIDYTNQVSASVRQELLKGTTPKANGSHRLTKEEIAKISDPAKRIEAIKNNIDLYQ